MASFQSKIGQKRLRKSEDKNYRSVPFLPDAKHKFRKEQQKNLENLKIPLWLHFNPKQVGRGQEKPKIEIIVPFRSYPALNRKLKQNSKKIQKIKKYHYEFISNQNKWENDEKERKFQNSSKKIQKIKKYHYWFISSQYRPEKAEKNRK